VARCLVGGICGDVLHRPHDIKNVSPDNAIHDSQSATFPPAS
jgi:hypothetical protein